MTATETSPHGSESRHSAPLDGDPAPPKAARRRPRLKLGITAVLATASAAVALIFTLAPDLRPDPRDRLSGELRVLTVEPGVRLVDWQRRTGQRVRPGPFAWRRGYVVYLQVEINGRKDNDVVLRESHYRARTGTRIGKAERVVDFRADTPSDRYVAQPFIVPPFERFYARYELYDRDTLLAFADTKPLAGAR